MSIQIILENFKNYLAKKKFRVLTKRKFTDKEYELALNVWKKFKMKAMKDYHDLYLKCHALLLDDVFEKLRNNSWDSLLKMTKIELEIITDPDMYIFFKKGARGGISYISNRYTKDNNKYLKSYDKKQESKHIINLDANDLYRFAMSKFFPTIRFKWIDPKEFNLNK